jgi:hypothetical protein
MTLRIERSTRQRFTVFTLSGRMEAAQIPELKELFDLDYRNIILDLRDVRLADRDAVRFLKGCEAEGMKLENCPACVREWIQAVEMVERSWSSTSCREPLSDSVRAPKWSLCL